MILIISKDKDFSAIVAEQVKRELSLPYQIAENNESAKTFMPSAALVITTEAETENAPCPVIVIKNPPIRLSPLLADIASALQKQAGESLDLGQGYGLQLRQKQLTHAGSGTTVDVTDKEIQLLQCLTVAKGESVSKEQLLKNVWGIDADLNTHTLETHIYRLRGKLRELAGEELIEAVNGGYVLK